MTRFPKILFLLLFTISVLTVVISAQSGGVKGKVRAPNGKGIPNATITVRLDGKEIKTAASDSKGDFTISGLEKGKYSITFDAAGFVLGVVNGVEIRDGIRSLGDRLILWVDPGTQVLIRGSVFSKEGASLAAARIELEQVNTDGSIKSLASTYSNTSGEFAFRRPEGFAKLRVTAKLKGVSGSKDLEVEDASIYRVAITLNLFRDNF